MRAAIQISGEFRTLHFSYYSFIEHICKNLEANGYTEIFIFIHCWKREESSLGTFPFEGRGEWHKTMPVYSNDFGLEVYQPAAYLFENLEDIDFLKGRSRILCMYYSIYMANEIRKQFSQKTQLSFDLVIRYRTDLILEEPLLKNKPEESSFLVIPKSTIVSTCDGPFESSDKNHICDYLAYGTPDTMDIYCNTFLTWIHLTPTPIGESCLAMHLAIHKLRATRIPLAFYLVEGDGQKRGMVQRSDFIETDA